MKKKRDSGLKEPSAPFWMVTYGDMMTLLLVFFVLLFSMSTLDEVRFEDFIASFHGRERTVVDFQATVGVTQMMGNGVINFPIPVHTQEILDEQDVDRELMIAQYTQQMQELFASPFETYFDHLDGTPELAIIVHDEDWTVEFILEGDLLFASGRSDAGTVPYFYETMAGIAAIILATYQSGDVIIVEGHTDNVPLSPGARYRDNWVLSGARAGTVITALQEATGLPGSAFEGRHLAYHRPVADNDTPEGRALNRRVVIYMQMPALGDMGRFSQVDQGRVYGYYPAYYQQGGVYDPGAYEGEGGYEQEPGDD